MRRGPVAGVLLAAGDGSRLGQPKATVIAGGQSLARRGIATLRAGGAAPVIVVTGAAGAGNLGAELPVREPRRGPAGDDLTDEAGSGAAPGFRKPDEPDGAGGGAVLCVHNPDWPGGMGSSLRAGLAAVPAYCAAAVLALADQPLVGAAAVSRLIDAYRAGADVAVACYAGRPRNPVLISRQYWPQAAALAVGDVGARPFLRSHPDLVTDVECGDTGQPDDVDTPEDLERVRRLLARQRAFPT